MADIVAGGVALGVNDALEQQRANRITRLAFFALIGAYAFLIWFSFLGGQRVLIGNL